MIGTKLQGSIRMKFSTLVFPIVFLISPLASAQVSEVNLDAVREPAADAPTSSESKIVSTSKDAEATGETLDQVIERGLKAMVSKTAAAKGRVAVMDFPSLQTQKLTALSSYISNKAGNRFIEAGRQVVDRGALERIISEQKLQQNSLMDAATASKVGKLAGAGVFIVGNYSILSKKFVMTVRALSVETGQFVAASEETVPLNTDLKSELDELHAQLLKSSTTNSLETSEASAPSEEFTPTEDNAMAEFDKKVCAIIRADVSILKIYKIAYESGVFDISKMGDYIDGHAHSDEAGDQKSWAYNLGKWWLITDPSGIFKPSIGAAIKGKFEDMRLKAWLYDGDPKGLAACIDRQNWWQENRPSAAAKTKKKK